MSSTTAEALVTTTLTTFGASAIVILTAVIGVGVAFLIFRFGWRKVKGSMR